MSTKLSTSLYDAQISGDYESAEIIKNAIDERYNNSFPKPKEKVINFNTIFNDDRSSVRSIYDFLNKEFKDWWEWEIETLDRLLLIKFSVALDETNRDKVFAIRHLCNSDQPFWDWFEFNQTALSFSHSLADFEYLRKPSPGAIINAVKTMNYIRPDRNGEFNNEVVKYICISLVDDGLYVPPPSILDMVRDKFVELVSKETVDKWPAVYDKYRDIVTGKKETIEENFEDIQARRIFSAEAAAISYGG